MRAGYQSVDLSCCMDTSPLGPGAGGTAGVFDLPATLAGRLSLPAAHMCSIGRPSYAKSLGSTLV